MDLLLTYLALDSQQSINQMKEEVVGAVAKTLPAVERHVRIKGGVFQNHLKDDKEYRLDNSQKVQVPYQVVGRIGDHSMIFLLATYCVRDRPIFRVEAFLDLRPKISQSRERTKIKLKNSEFETMMGDRWA
jgi:hypothetical protein